MSTSQTAVHKGIVKQVLSGDAVVIRGQPKGGPPPEKTICFSNITAPRMARRPNPAQDNVETKDEPFAWEAREYLRKKLIGKEVAFVIEYTVPGTGREYGCVYLGKDIATGENITEALVSEGLVEVRRGGLKLDDQGQQQLIQLEDAAKSAGKGKWNTAEAAKHIRNVKWTVENARNFVDSHHNKPIDAVIEHVRDGCTVRAFLLPSFDYVTIMLSGIKCPMFKQDESGKQVPELFAEEAKYFTEVRLLQRDVQIILEGVSNNNLLGTVLHPNGNIAELLLREGFARCVDWSMGVVTQGADKLRAAEKIAKEKKARLWKDYSPSGPTVDIKDKTFSGKVVEVVNGDALVVKTDKNLFKKVFLSSIRPPRNAPAPADSTDSTPKPRGRPLYDVPYMFEAREFLRKKLIGKKVNVQVDYIQPANNNFPEKTCCTVTISGINVGEALVGKGLATVVRYRMEDDQRSEHYDELLAAEARAQKKGVGLHSKKEAPIHRVADVSGDLNKCKQFLPFLQRAGKTEAIVEFVASGSRVRLYLPKETCLTTFLISGIECPRGARPLPGGQMSQSEPYGDEALQFTKEMCLQREVEVRVETMDKGGNFIGWLFVDNTNLSVALVEEGLAKVHFTAERSNYYKQLQIAEENAKRNRRNLWKDYQEVTEVEEVVEDNTERNVSYKSVVVTEVTADLKFFAQLVDNGPQLENLMEQLRQDMTANPPLPGAYTPKRNDMCAAKFSQDSEWYRAKVERVDGSKVTVLFIDYGNKEQTTVTSLATLPASLPDLAPQATEYCLAFVALPPDGDLRNDAEFAFYDEIAKRQLNVNVEHEVGDLKYVSLVNPKTKENVAQKLISSIIQLAEKRRKKRLNKSVSDNMKAQKRNKTSRVSTNFNNPKGNKNLGNTCYFNSILQALYFTQSLEESLSSLGELNAKTKNSEEFLSEELFELLKKQRQPCNKIETSINPTRLFRAVRKHPRNYQFAKGKQMDSFELFNALIVGIFDEMDLLTEWKAIPSTDEIGVRDLFTGLSLRVYVYCSCNHVEVDFEKFTSLSIPIVHKTEIERNLDKQYPVELQTLCEKELESGLERGLAALEQIEEYSGCDLPCPTCKIGGSEKVYRRLLLFQPPPVLVLRIDRFRMKKFNQLVKNTERVEYPRTLDLSTFCSVATRYAKPQINDPYDERRNDHKYELYAVVVHRGTVSSGHYFAFVNTNRKHVINRWKDFISKRTKNEETLKEEVESIFKEKKHEIEQTENEINPNEGLDKPEVTPNWFCVNDENVQQVEQDEVLRCKDAYLLFYEAQ